MPAIGRRKRAAPKKRARFDAVTDYAQKVVGGEIVAGKLAKLACKRHLEDLEKGSGRGLSWRPDLADRVFAFFHCLRLSDGEHAGKPFELSAHQRFIAGSLFGWITADGFRRYRTGYVEEAKGNGKTPLAAGIGLFGLVADGEDAAEVYSAAVGRDQAKICFTDAKNFVDGSRALRRRLTSHENNLAYPAKKSFFRPVSSEGKGLDGKRVHVAVIDELHEHPSSVVVDKMRAGTKGRRQALIFEITNSGFDRHSVCYQHHDYSVKVLEGIFQDDSWFAFIAAVDEQIGQKGDPGYQPADNPLTDESCWLKANPNLDVSITRKYLREQVREALGMPSKQNIVKRLNFCIWTEQSKEWIPIELWDASAGAPVQMSALHGRECFAGLDLASTADITALVLDFPEPDGSHIWLPFFWVPEENVARRVEKDRVPYDVWIREGMLLTTPGNVVDYDFIRAFINETIVPQFQLKELALDRLFQAAQMSTDLQADGITVVAFGQGFLSMAAPAKQFEELVRKRKLRHGGHPVLRWMAKNVAAAEDPAGNKKPDKQRSRDKIDGIVAGHMALGRAMAQPAQPAPPTEVMVV